MSPYKKILNEEIFEFIIRFYEVVFMETRSIIWKIFLLNYENDKLSQFRGMKSVIDIPMAMRLSTNTVYDRLRTTAHRPLL